MNTQKHTSITRKEALTKLGNYGKYAALTALGTYLILDPQKAQASSASSPGPSSPDTSSSSSIASNKGYQRRYNR